MPVLTIAFARNGISHRLADKQKILRKPPYGHYATREFPLSRLHYLVSKLDSFGVFYAAAIELRRPGYGKVLPAAVKVRVSVVGAPRTETLVLAGRDDGLDGLPSAVTVPDFLPTALRSARRVTASGW